MLKNEAYICPFCGSNNTRIEDYEMDIDCLWVQHRCKDCQTLWDEYYTLTYDGYVYDGKSYDADGKENEV